MGSEPTVACILLTKDRPELAARAVRCFRAQTYERKRLIIVDTGTKYCEIDETDDVWIPEFVPPAGATIGYLRNMACKYAAHHYIMSSEMPKIFCTFDDDDFSHPNRIAEQVAFLQSSGAAVVGYNQMLFWRKSTVEGCGIQGAWERGTGGESWLYTGPSHQPLGTSLCYWRKTWEEHRFDDRKHAGEDSDFLARVNHRRVKSVSSLHECALQDGPCRHQPRMIATVHGANTQQATYDGFFKGGTVEMRRVPEWDERVHLTLEGV